MGEPWVVPADWDDAARFATLARLAEQGARDPAVIAAADAALGLRPWHSDRYAVNFGAATALLALVHALVFFPDPPGVDTYQNAAYTLAHGGDCEDLSVLYAALCAAVGVRARIVWLAQPGEPQAHVTVQVQPVPRGPWLWAEPSIPSAAIGEDPYAAARREHREDRIRGLR
jgi:hypothetical protein